MEYWDTNTIKYHCKEACYNKAIFTSKGMKQRTLNFLTTVLLNK